MFEKPIVSVVIPTYNQAELLREAIQSVLDQTFMEWELIIVNNYSEDHTLQIVNSYNDSRIQLVNFRNNGIIAASRNEGIRIAVGEYIAFLDSDDKWYPTKLKVCFEELKQGFDIICHGLICRKGDILSRKIYPGEKRRAEYLNLLYQGNCLFTSAVIVRKQWLTKVGYFDESAEIVTAEDYDLWLKLAHNNAKFLLLNELLGEYRLHDNNASKAVICNAKAISIVIEKHFTLRGDVSVWERMRIRRRRALVYYGAGRNFQQSKQKGNAVKYFWKCIFTFPFILRVYAALCLNLFYLEEKNRL